MTMSIGALMASMEGTISAALPSRPMDRGRPASRALVARRSASSGLSAASSR